MDMEQKRREIGQRLKRCRNERDMTQAELSEKIGLEAQSYSNIETGLRLFSVEVLMSLSETLDVSADYILFGKINENSPIKNLVDHMDSHDLEQIEKLIQIYEEAKNC